MHKFELYQWTVVCENLYRYTMHLYSSLSVAGLLNYYKPMPQDIKTLFKEFLRECEFVTKLRPETLRGYISSFELLIKIIPDISLTNLDSHTITIFFERLQKRERKSNIGTKTGIKETTVATYRSKLNKFFEWLRIRKHIPENPFRDIAYPSVNYDDVKYLNKEEVEKIISAVVTKSNNKFIQERNMAIIVTGLFCGLRKNEILELKVFDIDLPREQLRVRSETSKSKRERTVPLNNEAKKFIKNYLEERQKLKPTNPYLFLSSTKNDQKLTKHGLKHLVNNIKLRSGVNFTLHRLRHTYAINNVKNNTEISKIKQLLGHKNISMTQVYLRCIPTKAMRADVEKLSFDNLL